MLLKINLLPHIIMIGVCDVLSPIQLKHISEHKYKATGCTLLDPIMQPFWNCLVQKFPLWLAPNTMTIIGLAINVFTSLLLVYYSPNCLEEAPRWAFVVCALGLFVYQTLDACDGKQARRTNSSSPLGELFDHGCDALSTVFVAVTVCVTVQFGTHPAIMFYQCFLAYCLFYCAHWQTYVSGTLGFGTFDVTEVQISIIFMYLITAIFGPSIWSITIPVVSLPLKLLPTIVETVTSSFVLRRYLTNIFTGGIGKNGSTVAGTSVLSPFVPMGLVLLLAFTIYQKSVEIYENFPCLYLLAFGFVSAKVSTKLVVAHMSKSKITYVDSIFIGPAMLFLNQYFDKFINEYIVLWLCIVYVVADFLIYSSVVCNQICSYLHIQLFTIVPGSSSSDVADTSNSTSPLLKCVSNGMQWAGFHKHF